MSYKTPTQYPWSNDIRHEPKNYHSFKKKYPLYKGTSYDIRRIKDITAYRKKEFARLEARREMYDKIVEDERELLSKQIRIQPFKQTIQPKTNILSYIMNTVEAEPKKRLSGKILLHEMTIKFNYHDKEFPKNKIKSIILLDRFPKSPEQFDPLKIIPWYAHDAPIKQNIDKERFKIIDNTYLNNKNYQINFKETLDPKDRITEYSGSGEDAIEKNKLWMLLIPISYISSLTINIQSSLQYTNYFK